MAGGRVRKQERAAGEEADGRSRRQIFHFSFLISHFRQRTITKRGVLQ
jgi:hypothetical protein